MARRCSNRTLRSLLDAGVDRVAVVVAPGVDLSAARMLADPRVHRVVNPDPSRGMFSSIQVGLAAAEGNPILVLPGDMPFVLSSTRSVVVPARRAQRHLVLLALS